MREENSFCLIFLEEFPTFLNCLSFTINGYIYQHQTTEQRDGEWESNKILISRQTSERALCLQIQSKKFLKRIRTI